MPIRKTAKFKRWLQSEILLIIFGSGISFLIDPDLLKNPSYVPLRFFPALGWAVIFLSVASIGFFALYRGMPALWQVFCYLAIFLFLWMSIARIMVGQVDDSLIFLALAWSSVLRALGIGSATFSVLKT